MSAYEQAFQLAATDADRSCILTAMGMLGYALDDKDGAKAMLFKRWKRLLKEGKVFAAKEIQ